MVRLRKRGYQYASHLARIAITRLCRLFTVLKCQLSKKRKSDTPVIALTFVTDRPQTMFHKENDAMSRRIVVVAHR